MICFAFSMAEMLSEVVVVGLGPGQGREGFQLLFHSGTCGAGSFLCLEGRKNVIGELMWLPNVIKGVPDSSDLQGGGCCVPASVEGAFHPGKWHNHVTSP